jgi:hypothetical protein
MAAPVLPFDDTLRFRPVEGLEEIPWGRKTALYRAGMAQAVVLNRVGSILWRHFQGAQSTTTLVGHLSMAFPATPRARLEADVRAYLDLLWKRGIIAPVEDSKGA